MNGYFWRLDGRTMNTKEIRKNLSTVLKIETVMIIIERDGKQLFDYRAGERRHL